jgi:hypothetical protein
MTEPRLDRRSTDARLGLLERDMAELLPLVRKQQDTIQQMHGVVGALRIAALLASIIGLILVVVQALGG